MPKLKLKPWMDSFVNTKVVKHFMLGVAEGENWKK